MLDPQLPVFRELAATKPVVDYLARHADACGRVDHALIGTPEALKELLRSHGADDATEKYLCQPLDINAHVCVRVTEL